MESAGMSQFVVTISACPRRRAFVAMGAYRCESISARVLGQMYRDAVIAEMHGTVRAAVAIHLNSNEGAVTNGVEVRVGNAARGMGFGAVTNRGMSYMFELRDAVNEVIRTFEPPPEAWVDDVAIAPPPGVPSMTEAEAQITAALLAGMPAIVAAPPQLGDSHVQALATAAQGAHYPDTINEIETAAPQYINDAKSFIAMFNAAIGILSQLFPVQHPTAPPPNPTDVQAPSGP
jgi:hypothetical protein